MCEHNTRTTNATITSTLNYYQGGKEKKYLSCCLTVAPLHADLDGGVRTVNV